MRTNLFKPKSVKKDKITIEEERLDSPLLLLFKKYGCLAVLFFFLIFVVIGYFTLRVQSGHISNIKRMESASRYSFYI